MDDKHNPEWRVVGQSVRGASHERSGLPNQDAVGWSPQTGTGMPLVVAASDGHGSARYFRSQTGARLAVETAIEVAISFLDGRSGGGNLSLVKRTAEEWLPKMLVRRWREAVREHVESNPLNEIEIAQLDEIRVASSSRKPGDEDLLRAYGATLLLAVVTGTFILYMQLGDGDILSVSERGEVSRPLPGDERLFGNETTSLCAFDAWRDFRVCFQTVANTPPALILLSTDGYANSFRHEADFLKVGSDIFEMIRVDGLGHVSESLEEWLAESTRAGSGDDVTMSILCRTGAFNRAPSEMFGARELPPETETETQDFGIPADV